MGRAAAECDGPPPPFRETVTTARQVVIGEVVATRPSESSVGARSSRFTVKVSHLVRGEPFPLVEVNDLMSQPCASYLVAGVGDRVALALRATAFTPPVEANGIAWLAGVVTEGGETTTVAEVFSLAGVPIAAEAPPTPPTVEASSPWPGAALWGLGVAAVLVVVLTVARRLRPAS